MKNHFIKGILQGCGILIVLATAFGLAVAADIFTVDESGVKKFVVSDQGKITVGATESYVNLFIQNNTVAPANKVDMTADVLTIEGIRIENLNISTDITVAGAGGLDTGAEAGNTWYYLWAITNNDGSSTNGLISTSSTAPTMPGGFTKKRRIGSVRNNAASDFLIFRQSDKKVVYVNGSALQPLQLGAATSYTIVSLASHLPTTSRLSILNVEGDFAHNPANVTFAYRLRETGDTNLNGTFLAIMTNQVINVFSRQNTIVEQPCNTSQQIDYKLDAAPNVGGVTLMVLGYYDRI